MLKPVALLIVCPLLAVASPKSSVLVAGQQSQSQSSASTCTETLESAERDKWQKPVEVIAAMNLKPGHVVVDIGAGTGYFSRHFSKAVGAEGKVIGVDIQSSMVRALIADKKRWGLRNYEARLVPADDPLLDKGSVDVAFVCDTYHHIEGRVAYFSNLKTAFRPGGRLVIVDPVKPDGYTNDGAEKRFTTDEVIDELRRAGYRLTKRFDFLLPHQYFLEFEPASGQNKPAND